MFQLSFHPSTLVWRILYFEYCWNLGKFAIIGLHKSRLSVSFGIFWVDFYKRRSGKVIHNLTAFMLSWWLVSHIKWPNRIATDAVPDWHCDTTMWRPCFSWMFWVTQESFKQKLRLCIAIEKRNWWFAQSNYVKLHDLAIHASEATTQTAFPEMLEIYGKQKQVMQLWTAQGDYDRLKTQEDRNAHKGAVG